MRTMTPRGTIGLLMALGWFAGVMHAQDLSRIPAAFVDIGFGARPVALGNAFVGLANDANSVVWNPAGLINVRKNQATFSYCKQLSLIPYAYFAGALPLVKGDQTLGLGVIASGDAALRELTVQVSYARALTTSLYIGGTAKFRNASFGNNALNATDYPIWEQDEIDDAVRNQVKGQANGLGFDLGLLYKLNDGFTFGIMLKDLYSPMFWKSKNDNPSLQPKGNYTETIPFEPTFGSALRPLDNVVVTTDYSPSTGPGVSNEFKFGVEATFLDMVSFRGGSYQFLNNRPEDDKYALGIGLDVKQIKDVRILVDYTFLFDNLSNTQRISLGVEF